MQNIGLTEAKAKLADLLRAVENGEAFAITRHGRAIAHLIPAPSPEDEARKEALDRFLKLRDEFEPSKMTAEDSLKARHEGHRA